MAIIPQKSIFSWEQVEELGDLERLQLVLKYMPDEELMQILEKERGKGRDDYPIRAVWNSVLAGIVFQHKSVESLRRELLRNGQLRQMCGFDVCRGNAAVPPPSAYTHFLQSLIKHTDEADAMFDALVEEARNLLPDFGRRLATDGKAIETHANAPKKDAPEKERDGRRDIDADWGKKEYKGKNKDGSEWKKVVKWFGYKLHLIVDTDYELPVAYELEKASSAEIPEARRQVKKLAKVHPELIEGTEILTGDKGLDDTKLITTLWDDYGIRPVIDIRNMWKDNDGLDTKLVSGQLNVVYNYKGDVFCYCSSREKLIDMAYGGFERDRETLRYLCPAKHYGIECPSASTCPVNRSVRIKLEEDRRVFTPLARSSYRWEREYKKRTAVERVNSRIDVSFGFEEHYIRGQEKMRLRVGLALTVMLAMAVGRVKEGQPEKMRSLVQVA